MSWVDRLYRRLTSVWSRDALGLPAISIACDGTALAWQVSDGILTLQPTGGTATPYTVALSSVSSISALVADIQEQQGYMATLLCTLLSSELSPLSLVEGSNPDTNPSAQQLSYAQSVQYLILQAAGAELANAEAQIPMLPLQMATTTASGSWLDYLGGYYSVPRIPLEGDVAYAIRIIQETLRPKCNNTSMARAIQNYTGIVAQVTDVVNYSSGTHLFDGSFNFDGSLTFNSGYTTESGGLFDVEAGYDLIQGTELTEMAPVLTAYINRLKAAGTALRNLILAPLSALEDTANSAEKRDSLTVTYTYVFDGSFNFDGSALFAGGCKSTGTMSGPGTFSRS